MVLQVADGSSDGSSDVFDSRLVEALPLAVVVCDADGLIVRFNTRADDLVGRHLRRGDRLAEVVELFEPDGAPVTGGDYPVARALRSDDVTDEDLCLERADGSRVAVRVSARALTDEGGKVISVLATFQDAPVERSPHPERWVAADTVRAEGQIRERLANFGASLASELDPERLVQAVTDAATHLTSAEFGAFFCRTTNEAGEAYDLHALAGTIKAAISELPAADAMRPFSSAFRHEGIVRFDDLTQEPRRDLHDAMEALAGASTMRSYLAVPVVSRSREVLGGLLFGHSRPGMFVARHEQLAAGIASWAAMALDNARLYKAAQDANSTKDEFLATLSHELRTPLNAMLGWTHLLRSGALSGDMRQRALDALERNGRAQAQLIDDLLDVSRIVSGRLELKSEDVELGGIIASAIETVRPSAAAKELKMRMLLPDKDILISGDADRLRQIFWNLLTNAVKFTPARGGIDVEMRSVDGGAGVAVDVRDTGVGIDREVLGHVFERFRQADSSHSRKHGGLGLGLAIVRHLVEAHGGTVAVESEGEGLGATFTVHFPVRAVRRPMPATGDEAEKHGATLAGLSILVVDDERDAREFLAALLSLHGANVELAASAGEALGIIASSHVDVLLADLGLPGRDGYALIQAIRSLPPERGGAVPAVAVTAYAGLRERSRAFEAGFGWHVAKPVDADQLLSVVTAAARSRQVTTGDDRSRQVTSGHDR